MPRTLFAGREIKKWKVAGREVKKVYYKWRLVFQAAPATTVINMTLTVGRQMDYGTFFFKYGYSPVYSWEQDGIFNPDPPTAWGIRVNALYAGEDTGQITMMMTGAPQWTSIVINGVEYGAWEFNFGIGYIMDGIQVIGRVASRNGNLHPLGGYKDTIPIIFKKTA